MPDLHVVLFDYHGTPVYCRLGLGTETPELARFMGPKGILDAGEFNLRYAPQPGIDLVPSYYASGFPQKMRAEYEAKWYRGHDWDDMNPHMWNFFESVKSRKPVVEDAVFGNHAAIACHMANESYFSQKTVYWDEANHSIKS